MLITYHFLEEYLIAGICFFLAIRSWRFSEIPGPIAESELKSRNFLFGFGFIILGVSSFIHASIHALPFASNVLYQTPLGYCAGLLCIILAISSDRPHTKLFFSRRSICHYVSCCGQASMKNSPYLSSSGLWCGSVLPI